VCTVWCDMRYLFFCFCCDCCCVGAFYIALYVYGVLLHLCTRPHGPLVATCSQLGPQCKNCIDSHWGYARRSWKFERHLWSSRDGGVWFGCIYDHQATHGHDTGFPGLSESTLRAAGILRRF